MTIDLRPFAEAKPEELEDENVIDLSAFRTKPPEEETKKKRSLGHYLYDIMGEGLAIQAKIIPGPDVAPQFFAGQLEEVTAGKVKVLPAKTPGGKFARETGKTTALISGLGLLGKLFKPLGFLQKALGISGFGGVRNAANQYFEKGEVDLKEVGVQTALFGALELGSEAVSTVLNTRKAINFISESTGQTKPTVAKFLAETALDNIKRKFGFKPTEGTISALTELNPEAVAEAWEGAINTAKKTVEEGKSLSTELATDIAKEGKGLAPAQPVIDLAPFAEEVTPVVEPTVEPLVEPKAPPVINLRPVAKEGVVPKEPTPKPLAEKLPGSFKEREKTRQDRISELVEKNQKTIEKVFGKGVHFPTKVYNQVDFWEKHRDLTKEQENLIDTLMPEDEEEELENLQRLQDRANDARNSFNSAEDKNRGIIDALDDISREILDLEGLGHKEIIQEVFQFLKEKGFSKKDIIENLGKMVERRFRAEDVPFLLEQIAEEFNLRPVAKESVPEKERLSQEVEQLKNQIEQIPGKTQKVIKERSPLIQELNKKELELSKLKKEPTVQVQKTKFVDKNKNKQQFETAKGSVYAVNQDGTTTRFKAQRVEDKDSGLKPTSQKTLYVTPEDSFKLGEFQLQGGPSKGIALFSENRAGVQNLSGKNKGKTSATSLVNFETTPREGLIPVELFDNGRRVHFGNEITKVSEPIKQPLKPVVEKSQPPKKPLPAKTLTRAVVKKEPPKQPPPPTPPPPSKPPPPEQPSGEDPGSPEKINSETARFFSKAAAKLSVEFPFVKIGAPETGFAVKNYYDQINKNVDQGKSLVKAIKNVGLTKEQLNNSVLQAESVIPPKDPKEREVWKMIRSYFDKSLEDLKRYGVIKKGFSERIKSNILAELGSLDEIIKISKGNTKAKYIKQKADLKEQLKDIADLRFVSIPVRHFFDSKMRTDPALTRKAVKFLNKKRRKTLRLQDLVDSGLIKKKDLTPELVINSYARKFGRDIALAKIIQSAKKEGLATEEFKEGAVKVPGYLAPELAKYWINPVFADYIKGYTDPRSFSLWDKLANRLKGWSFYNPSVLVTNDILQQAWMTLGQPQAIHKLPGVWKLALKDMIQKTDNYWEAYDNGTFSSVFVELEKNIASFKDLIKKDGPGPLLDFLESMLKLPIKLHEKIYDIMQVVAWTGDKFVRMASYNWLRSIGFSPRDAAQLAAGFHGDYSQVPPETRRLLNKFLNTITFKIVMGTMLKETITNSGKLVSSIFKREKIDPKVRIKAGGLLGMGIMLGAVHMIMRSKGYETEIPGLRYKKNIIDKEGKDKTIHINFSLPHTIFWKFAVRGYEAATKPGVENRILKFGKSMKYELAQPIQILWELTENRRRNWDKIYDPRAPTHQQLASVLKYIFVRSVPMVGIPAGESFRDPEETEKLKKEIGFLPTVLPFMFPFLSDREEDVNRKKAMFLVRKMKSLLRRDKLSEAEKENYLREIERLRKG